MDATANDIFPVVPETMPNGPLHHPGIDKDFYLNLPDVTMFTFRVDLETHLLQFYRLLRGVPRCWSNELNRDNFVRAAKPSTRLEQFQPHKIKFEVLEERFAKPVHRQRRNTDVRAGFCWDDDHMFLVKAKFTFGQRTVPQGCVHVYRTTDAPILFYKHEPGSETRIFRVQDRWFQERDQFIYHQYVLQPHCVYVVPEATTYAIMTVQKTFFSVHVVSGSVEGKRPDTDRKLLVQTNEPNDGFVQKRKKWTQEFLSKRPRVDESSACYQSNESSMCYQQQQQSNDSSAYYQSGETFTGQPNYVIFEQSQSVSNPFPQFLMSPPPSYPPENNLETMISAEDIRRQIAELQKQLVAIQQQQASSETEPVCNPRDM